MLKNNKTLRGYNKLLEQIPQNKKLLAKNLIKELSFINATLEDLKEKIAEGGTVELFEQGKQKFYRESPALKSYNVTVQRYSLLHKQLLDLLPDNTDAPDDKELLDFVNAPTGI